MILLDRVFLTILVVLLIVMPCVLGVYYQAEHTRIMSERMHSDTYSYDDGGVCYEFDWRSFRHDGAWELVIVRKSGVVVYRINYGTAWPTK